jgi:hypothetical protein
MSKIWLRREREGARDSERARVQLGPGIRVAHFLALCVDIAAEYSPFYGIEKSAVLQEARCFNDRELDARRCAQVRVWNS